MNKQFSVLMSVYYKENSDFLDKALDSNLTIQTLKPSQFVLVCDGPLNDNLDAVIAKYQNVYPDVLKVVRLEKNVGLGEALRLGLEHCAFDIVARSDSDDICVPTRFEKQMGYLCDNPDISIISSHISEFNDDPSVTMRTKILPLTHGEIVKMAEFRNPINHMAVMFRKQAVLAAGSYVPLPYVEDYYLWVRAIKSGCKLANYDEVLVYARVGNGMEKRRSNRQYISSWKILTKYMKENKMISSAKAAKNMFAVRVFVYMPVWMKSVLYKRVLRSKKADR